jgi:hypothetical protein
MTLNPWKYYEMIQHSKELDKQVKSIFGQERFEELERYIFEFSCEEAGFLGITRENFDGEIEYMVAFNRLCRFRREALLRDVLSFTVGLEKKLKEGENLADKIELSLNYSLIPADVKKIYEKG